MRGVYEERRGNANSEDIGRRFGERCGMRYESGLLLEDLRMRGLGDSGDLLLLCLFCLIKRVIWLGKKY